jgi:hypothetical protein
LVKAERLPPMSELDEEQALAILFGNTKRKKRAVDLVTLARSCEFLVKKYGSKKEAAKRLDLSPEMIRELLIPLSLPERIQRIISKRRIDSIDIVREIATIKDKEKQFRAVSLFEEMQTMDVRDIKRLVNESGVSVEEAKNSVLEFKEKNVHVFLIDISDEMYRSIKAQASKMELSPAILVKIIIHSWVKSHEAE